MVLYFMANREAPTKYKIPAPTSEAYFPPLNPNAIPKAEVIKRAGEENLVCAFEYGSHITGDASPTSIYDVMIIVADTKKFHEENIQSHKTDYGNPKSAKWHAFLNTFGFNFY